MVGRVVRARPATEFHRALEQLARTATSRPIRTALARRRRPGGAARGRVRDPARVRPPVARAARGRGRDAARAAPPRLAGRADHRVHRGRRAAVARVGVRGPLRRRGLLVAARHRRSPTRGSTCTAPRRSASSPARRSSSATARTTSWRARCASACARCSSTGAGEPPMWPEVPDVGWSARDVDSRGLEVLELC